MPSRTLRIAKSPRKDSNVHEITTDDAYPPALKKEAKCKDTSKNVISSAEGVNLFQALLSISSDKDNTEPSKSSDDPFPEDFEKGLSEPLCKPHSNAKVVMVNKNQIIRAMVPTTAQLANQYVSKIVQARAASGTHQYTLPPAHRRFSSMSLIGSNTSKNPAKLLENRKRELQRELRTETKAKEAGDGCKRPMLEIYKEGRGAEKFRAMSTSSNDSFGTLRSFSSSPEFDIQSMLQKSPAVQMEITVGGNEKEYAKGKEEDNSDQDQQNMLEMVAKESSTQSILMSSMVINALNILRERNPRDYRNFSSDLFALITKYRIQ